MRRILQLGRTATITLDAPCRDWLLVATIQLRGVPSPANETEVQVLRLGLIRGWRHAGGPGERCRCVSLRVETSMLNGQFHACFVTDAGGLHHDVRSGTAATGPRSTRRGNQVNTQVAARASRGPPLAAASPDRRLNPSHAAAVSHPVRYHSPSSDAPTPLIAAPSSETAGLSRQLSRPRTWPLLPCSPYLRDVRLMQCRSRFRPRPVPLLAPDPPVR
ncbi:hypothetical protein VUR80DRAFT_4764 [Thermomyces stellatus]